MAESSMAVPEKDGVLKSDYAWGAKVGSNYKSVTVDGEVFWLGDCVRYLLNSKPGHIGKIVKLFEKDGKQMCRIRSFYSPSEFTSALKGLDYTPEPKELFLATGDGLGVEKDILLRKIAGRCMVLCTAEESFNMVPSHEQVEAADYFFQRAYDPADEEVVGLDVVEDAIGAQKLFNKKEWLVPVDKPVARSSPQVSASKIHRQSPAVSGSSSHQGAVKGMPASLSEVSPALSGDSAERKWKNRNIDKSVAEPPEFNAVKKTNELSFRKNEMSAVSREKPSAHSEQLVFAIPAPSEVNLRQRPEVTPVMKGKPPTSSKSKAKAIKPEGKGESMAKASHPEVKGESRRVSSSSIPPVGSKQKVGTKEGAVSDVKKRKYEHLPGTEGPRKKILKPTERSNVSVEREKHSQLQKRADGGISRGSSPAAELQNRADGGISRGSSPAAELQNRADGGISRGSSPAAELQNRADGGISRGSSPAAELQNRADGGISRGSSPAAEQKHRGQIFKPKQDWDVANLVPAIQNNRVLLLENLAAGLHSDDLAEALSDFFKHRCDVRIAPPESSSFRTTSALLKFPTATLAFKINESINSRNVIVSGRLVTASLFKYQDFKPKSSTPLGHIELPKGGRDYNNEDYRDAVATSHLAQGNTIEFDYGLQWRVLDDQHEEQWHMLQEEFNSKKTIASKKMA